MEGRGHSSRYEYDVCGKRKWREEVTCHGMNVMFVDRKNGGKRLLVTVRM